MTVGEGGIRIITILITITTPIATTLIITIIDTATTGRTTIAHTTTIVGITEQRVGTRLSRGRGHRHDPGRHAWRGTGYPVPCTTTPQEADVPDWLRVLPPPERAGGERLLGGGGADIAAHHRLRGMAGVPHDVALVDAGLGEGGDAAGAQAVRADAGECGVPVAGFPGALFQDRRTLSVARGWRPTASLRLMRRNTHPARIPAESSQARSAATGQWAVSGLAARWTLTPAPSWSALERGSSTLSPCGPKQRSATRIITSSARRKAPAKPSRISARSRSPRRSPPQTAATRSTSAVSSGAAWRSAWSVAPGDALQGPAQHRVAPVERQAEQGVRLDDGGEPAGQGGVGALAGEFRQMVGDQGRRGGAGEGAAALAPSLPGAQMAGVGAAGRGRERLAGVLHRRRGQRLPPS